MVAERRQLGAIALVTHFKLERPGADRLVSQLVAGARGNDGRSRKRQLSEEWLVALGLVDDDRIVAVDFDRFGRAEDELHDGPGVGVRDTVVAVFHVLGGEFAVVVERHPSEGERTS